MSFFVTFEGIDGCGKTTQLELLRAHLEAGGHTVVTTREPGGTALAEAIRNYLLHSTQALAPPAELLLFGAARAQHVAELVRPALECGEVVLSDRFADSSMAYQGGGLGLDMEFIAHMNAFATTGLWPDITFLLDVDPKVGHQRRADQGEDRIELRGLEFQERVRESFLSIARDEPERVVIIDASPPAKVIHKHIFQALQERGLIEMQGEPHRPAFRLLRGGTAKKSKPLSTYYTQPSQNSIIPQSLEAEQSALGAMLIERDAVSYAIQQLSDEDFSRELHRKIFNALSMLFNRTEDIDLITVVEELRGRGQLEEVGGVDYLTALIEVCPSSFNIADYVRVVKEKRLLRQQIQESPADRPPLDET